MFLIVTCEKQIAITLLIIFECVTLLFQQGYKEHHMFEVGFFNFLLAQLFFFSHNNILLGAPDEECLFNNSVLWLQILLLEDVGRVY